MIWLLAFFVVHLAYSFYTGPVASASASNGLLAASLYCCWRLGGWTSPHAAMRWLKHHKQSGVPVAVPVIAGPIIILVLTVYSGKYTAPFGCIEALWIYFFFHGITAAWVALVRRLREPTDAA